MVGPGRRVVQDLFGALHTGSVSSVDVELRLLSYFVAVAEERHIGRAASRLRMTQPPLSRAIKRLEDQLGTTLMVRTPRGIDLTTAGEVLYDGARALLEQADQLRTRTVSAAGQQVLSVGTLADTAEQVGSVLVAEFRQRHPDVEVTIHESDLADPTAGLRTGLVEVAMTRHPFDDAGLAARRLRAEPVGMVMRTDDPLAERDAVHVAELTDRLWIRLPDSADAVWRAYWTVTGDRPGPVLRTIGECVQSVLWSGASALAPLRQRVPDGLVVVPVADRPPSQVVVAWRTDTRNPMVRAFVDVVTEVYGRAGGL